MRSPQFGPGPVIGLLGIRESCRRSPAPGRSRPPRDSARRYDRLRRGSDEHELVDGCTAVKGDRYLSETDPSPTLVETDGRHVAVDDVEDRPDARAASQLPTHDPTALGRCPIDEYGRSDQKPGDHPEARRRHSRLLGCEIRHRAGAARVQRNVADDLVVVDGDPGPDGIRLHKERARDLPTDRRDSRRLRARFRPTARKRQGRRLPGGELPSAPRSHNAPQPNDDISDLAQLRCTRAIEPNGETTRRNG